MSSMALKFNNKTSVIASVDTITEPYHQYITKVKTKLYKNYSPDDLRQCVIGWVLQRKKTNMTCYCKKWRIPRSTLLTYLKELPILREIRTIGGSNLQEVESIFDGYTKEKEKKKKKQLEVVCGINTYMSE